jgi:hypothetical protein
LRVVDLLGQLTYVSTFIASVVAFWKLT